MALSENPANFPYSQPDESGPSPPPSSNLIIKDIF